jgi:Pvc16 N-terminal domain
MIHDIDASLSALIKTEAMATTEAEVVFDAPTTEWAARRSGPVIDVFLYDLREDTGRRDAHSWPERDQTGRITGRRPGIRFFKLSYLLTAWTKRPEDEHRLLGQLLEALLCHDQIPETYLRGRVREQTVVLNLALPPGPDRSLTDLWTALGGEMKPSLDLVVVVPVAPERRYVVGPPVREEPRVHVLRHAPGLAAGEQAATGQVSGDGAGEDG